MSAFFYINLSAIFVILFSRNLIKIRLLTLGSSILLLIIISIINQRQERVLDKTLKQMNVINENKNENNNTEQLYFFTKLITDLYFIL